MNATQSALALTCEREHTAPRMQKEKKKKMGGDYYAPKYAHVCRFAHAHDTGGFQ